MHAQCQVTSQFSNKEVKHKNKPPPGEYRPSTHTNPKPATTSVLISSRQKGKMKMPTTTSANAMPAPKRFCGTDLLMRNNLPDIVAAMLNAFHYTTTTISACSSCLATQPATNLSSQPISTEEERQHQEIDE